MIDIFDFIDKGMEINTNELENLEAKSILLKIFETLDIKPIQPGYYKLTNSIKKYKLRFYKLMKNIHKERYKKILDYLEINYPLKFEFIKSEEEKKEEKKSVESSEQIKTNNKPTNNILGNGIKNYILIKRIKF